MASQDYVLTWTDGSGDGTAWLRVEEHAAQAMAAGLTAAGCTAVKLVSSTVTEAAVAVPATVKAPVSVAPEPPTVVTGTSPAA